MATLARHPILKSVFAVAPRGASVPTPQATPLVGQGSFDDQQRASGVFGEPGSGDAAAERIRWERAWHLATSFFTDQLKPVSRTKASGDCPAEVQESIRYLRSPDSVGYLLRKVSQADDLIWWYSQLAQHLFLNHHLPTLRRLCHNIDGSEASWTEFTQVFVHCRNILLDPYRKFLAPFSGHQAASGTDVMEENYKALVVESLSHELEPKLSTFIFDNASSALQSRSDEEVLTEHSMEGVQHAEMSRSSVLLLSTLSQVARGGLPTSLLERYLAKGLDGVIRNHVTSVYARCWESPSSCVDELKAWVAGNFTELASKSLHSIFDDPTNRQELSFEVANRHIVGWQQHAVEELGRLRLGELFDIIVDWDNGSKGGVEDLRHYVTTAARRMYVVNTFTGVLSYRLLIPGASTTEIIQMYMRIMRAFALLDHRFVILERVSRPVRRYLRDRDDTVKIIVGGLLADPANPEPASDGLIELAAELHEMDEITAGDEDFELDWDDMQWLPNPADAEPDFKKSRNVDVIGNLISLFDNNEILVREFQNILGERLLGASVEFDREIRVLELLKSRFGDAALQGCEVMLKDIFDSRRTDVLIKKEQKIESISDQHPEIYAKILSRFFWPSLRGEEFKVPPAIKELQDRYSHGFEEHKMQRKLGWLPALGQVTVELQLKYRTVKELVTTWQASVIYTFSSDDTDDVSPKKTADELATELEMDEELVNNALVFWVSKLVLYESAPGVYEVLEVLPTEQETQSVVGEQKVSANIVAAAQSASAAAAASAASAVRSEEELAEEKMEVIWQYVVGMLTNQGQMPLQQMVMMLNFVVPGGFTHSNEEFRSFLQRRVDNGRLEMAGANYRIPKK